MLIIGRPWRWPDLVVVEVVRRRDLDAAGAERRIDVVVGDDRDLALGERQAHPPADQVAVALVVGVHRDGGVAEHGLGPRGRDHERGRSPSLERIAQMPEAALSPPRRSLRGPTARS